MTFFNKRLLLATAILIGGCVFPASTLPKAKVSPERKITVGMTQTEADAILEKDTLQSGNLYWGGSGTFRRYYQLSASRQFWVEIGGSYDGQLLGKIVRVGSVEPFQQWIAHRGDCITVE